jgi:hypothetical protein
MTAAQDRFTEELARIEAVGVGGRDIDHPILFFDVAGDGWGALQILELDDPRAVELLSAVYDAQDLNGRACVVEKSEPYGGTVRFVRLLPPPRRRYVRTT